MQTDVETEMMRAIGEYKADIAARSKRGVTTRRDAQRMLPRSRYVRLERKAVTSFERLPRRAAVICDVVCAESGLSLAELLGEIREQKFVRWRRIALYLLVESGYSLTMIARIAGNMHHTTVMYHHRMCREKMAADAEYAERVERMAADVRYRMGEAGAAA